MKEEKRVVNDLPPGKRAEGVVLHSTDTVVAKDVNVEKLPTVLRPVFEKIQKSGAQGGNVDKLFPKDKNGKCYERWLVRCLVREGAVRIVPAPKLSKLTIAKAVAKKRTKAA